MPELLSLQSFCDSRGNLTVIDKVLPFIIKRVFYIYGVDNSVRGKHRHHKTIQAAVCLLGSCSIGNHDGREQKEFVLDRPAKCLLLFPEDFHYMHSFSSDCILMVLASESFSEQDYIYEPYE